MRLQTTNKIKMSEKKIEEIKAWQKARDERCKGLIYFFKKTGKINLILFLFVGEKKFCFVFLFLLLFTNNMK